MPVDEKNTKFWPSPASSRNIAAKSNSSTGVEITVSMQSFESPQAKIQSRRASELSRINAKLAVSNLSELSMNNKNKSSTKRDSSLPKPEFSGHKGIAVSLDSSRKAVDDRSNKTNDRRGHATDLHSTTRSVSVARQKASAAKHPYDFPRLHKTSSSTDLVPSSSINSDSPVQQEQQEQNDDAAETTTADAENTQMNEELANLKPRHDVGVLFVERRSIEPDAGHRAAVVDTPSLSILRNPLDKTFRQLHLTDEQMQLSQQQQSSSEDDVTIFTDQQLRAEMRRRRKVSGTTSRPSDLLGRLESMLRTKFRGDRSRSRTTRRRRKAKSEVRLADGYGTDEYSVKVIQSLPWQLEIGKPEKEEKDEKLLPNAATPIMQCIEISPEQVVTPSVSVQDAESKAPLMQDSIVKESTPEANTDIKMLHYSTLSPHPSPIPIVRSASETLPLVQPSPIRPNSSDIDDKEDSNKLHLPPLTLSSHPTPTVTLPQVRPASELPTPTTTSIQSRQSPEQTTVTAWTQSQPRSLPSSTSAQVIPATTWSKLSPTGPRSNGKEGPKPSKTHGKRISPQQTLAVKEDASVYDLAVYNDDNTVDNTEFFRRMVADELVLLQQMKHWRDKYNISH